MQSWILFSVLAASIWAVVNIIDKYLIEKHVRKPLVILLIFGILSLFVSAFIFFYHGFDELSFYNMLMAFVGGSLYVLGAFFYFKAVQIEEISRIVPLFFLSPLFLLFPAVFLLGETLTLHKYLGIFLLVLGAVLITTKNPNNIGKKKAVKLMVLATLCFSSYTFVTKYLLGFADYWTVFSYLKIGSFISLIPFFCIYHSSLTSLFKKSKRVIALISFNEALNLLATVLFTIAAASGFIVLVNALGSVQPFFVLLYTIILSIFYPRILKEEITKSTISLKLIAIIMMFIGVILIT